MQQQKRKQSKKIGDDSSAASGQSALLHLGITNQQSQQAYLNILEDMQADKQALEDQRLATFNIMEDITDAQEELQKRYQDLDVLKELVNSLGNSLKTVQVLKKLIRALKLTLPVSSNLVYLIPSPDPGIVSQLAYVHAATPLTKNYLQAVKKEMADFFSHIPIKLQRKKELEKWLQGEFRFEFVEGEQQQDPTDAESEYAQIDGDGKHIMPLSSYNIPILVSGELLGMLNISSSKPNLYTQKHLDLANTMVGTTASTISRLRQLLESEQSRISSLVKSLSNGVIMFDENMKVTMTNPAAQKMTGLPERGFYISEFNNLFAAAAAAAAAAADVSLEECIQKTLEDGEPTRIEEACIARFTYELLIHPVHDHEMNIIGGAIILHDVTHLKEVDRMKTEFVSIASHQLRTPLTGINWNLEMMLNDETERLSEKHQKQLMEIYNGSKRMVNLVNDLLNVSRLESGRLAIKPVKTDMIAFVAEIIDECNALAEQKGCSILFDYPHDQKVVLGIDPTLMRQVVHNLITNAIKYSKSKKKSKIIVQIAKSSENSHYTISVEDTGIGIPKRVQKRMFEKFFRADNAVQTETEGNGLGLYVVKMIVEASGGKIYFESKEGSGTTFYVDLPSGGMKKKKGEKGIAA